VVVNGLRVVATDVVLGEVVVVRLTAVQLVA
jgi:hypothetical protein